MLRRMYKENFDVRWVLLFLSLPSPSFALYKSRLSNQAPSFPYDFWKPKSAVDSLPSPLKVTKTSPKQDYGFFYGQPLAPPEKDETITWTLLPIKIPKDIVGEVKEKTTKNPLNDITTHPSSLIPQYGRHPGATESPPLFFPKKLTSEFLSTRKSKAKATRRYDNKTKLKQTKPRLRDFKNSRNRQKVSQPSSAHRKPPTQKNIPRKPQNYIKILSIDRNQKPPPHAFYAIQDSPDLKIGILHKNETHAGYLDPQEYNKKLRERIKGGIRAQRKPEIRPVRGKYDILDYSRYEVQNNLYRPQKTRKNYNENLIELIRKKIESKSVHNNRVKKPLYPKDNIFLTEEELREHSSWPSQQQEELKLKNSHRHALTSTYSLLNSTDPLRYQISRIKSQSSKIKPIFREPRPSKTDYPPRNPNYNPVKYNVDNRLTSRLKNLFNAALNFNSPPAPNVYPQRLPEPTTKPPKHYLYYYSKSRPYSKVNNYKKSDLYYKEDNEPQSNFIMERIASLQNAPASLVVPGGLAALGLGLAYYYFNYVWYPTPVVKARLSQLFETFGALHKLSKEDETTDEIGKILEAFRGIDNDQFGQDLTSESCKNRLVCQLHQDVPNLWDVTQVISGLLRTHFLDSSEYEKTLQNYLETADQGAHEDQSCESLFKSCSLPYIPLKPLVQLLFEPDQEESYGPELGESRVL